MRMNVPDCRARESYSYQSQKGRLASEGRPHRDPRKLAAMHARHFAVVAHVSREEAYAVELAGAMLALREAGMAEPEGGAGDAAAPDAGRAGQDGWPGPRREH